MKNTILIILLSFLFSSCIIRDALNDWYDDLTDEGSNTGTGIIHIIGDEDSVGGLN